MLAAPSSVAQAPRPRSTTDQRLLDDRGRTDWVHTDPWRVLRIQSEFVEGFGGLAEIGPAISVFGSARTPRDNPTYEMGVRLGAAIARATWSRSLRQARTASPAPASTAAASPRTWRTASP